MCIRDSIYDVVRTPCGRGDETGALFPIKPIDLLGRCLNVLQNRNQLEEAQIEDAILGCAVPFGDQGDNIMKTALLYAGWDSDIPAMQVNRFQASSLSALGVAAAKIKAGWNSLTIAGGLESTSRVKRSNFRGAISSDPNVINRIGSIPSGMAADLLATLHGIERAAIDAYALESHEKAITAQQAGYFQEALIPIYDQNDIAILDKDELITTAPALEQLEQASTIFPKWGRAGFEVAALKKYPLVERIIAHHTAENIAPQADGAALLLLGSKDQAKIIGRSPKAKVLTVVSASSDFTIMHLGGTKAAEKALQQAKLQPKDIDLWYVNEPFAAVALYFQRHFDIADKQLNACGGTIALGEPIGAIGAILLSILIHELERQQLKRGLLSIFAESGMGTCIIVEIE